MNLAVAPDTVIVGLGNIDSEGLLQVGLSSPNFVNRHDRAYLNIRGSLQVKGDCHIGQGCRVDVAPRVSLIIGAGTYIHPNSKLIVSQGIEIGEQCAISWDVNLIDDDFHSIAYPGRKPGKNKGIKVGNRVWIGAGVTLLAGTTIPDGCVIAANSTVRGKFEKENCLIAGYPGRIVKEGVSWE